jgi:hypothetical protein
MVYSFYVWVLSHWCLYNHLLGLDEDDEKEEPTRIYKWTT